MPSNNENDLDIDSLLDEQLGSSDNSRPNINRASYLDPDQQAEVITLAESRNIDTQTVENNLGEFKRRSTVEAIDTRGYPKLSQYLNDDRNSRVSVDDIDNLKGIEGAVRESEYGFWSNIGRGTLNRVNTLTGNLIEFTGNVGENFEDYLRDKGIPNPGIIIGDDGVSWSWDIPEETPNLLKNIGKAVSEGNGYGYQPRFTWERFKGDMNPKTLSGYIAEQGVQSVPDMMAAIFTLPAYITSRTEEIAEARVKNDERQDVTGQDLATSFVPAVMVSLIERLAGKVTLGVGGVTSTKTALKATGAAALTEGGTEFVQEGIEYLGETVGTKKDVSIAEMIDRQLAGMVAGSGMGASIRGTTSTYEALSSRTERNVETVIMSAGEQQIIDQIATFAQSSTTRGRKEDRFRNFLKGLETEKQVHISSDAVIEAAQNGVELPTYITEQLDGLGTDITVDMEQFGADIAPNEDIMGALRPHMRLSSDSLSPAQLEAADDFSIKSLLEKAEKSKAALTEAETIYEDVKQQLVDTGRQSEATARYSAAIIPAYATVKAEQTGKTVREIYEMMGLSIVGPATVNGDGKTLAQVFEAFHGTGTKFDKFDKTKLGSFTGADSSTKGFFFTSSRELAESFKSEAERKTVDLEGVEKSIRGLSNDEVFRLFEDAGLDDIVGPYDPDDVNGAVTDIITLLEEELATDALEERTGVDKIIRKKIGGDHFDKGEVKETSVDLENPLIVEFKPDDELNEGAINEAIDEAQKSGNDGVIFKNMKDAAVVTEKGDGSIVSDVYFVFDDKRIGDKSDVDPRRINEGDAKTLKTGEPVTFRYSHNTESATEMFGIPDKDASYGRGYEPSGRFVSIVGDKYKPFTDKIITGNLTFTNPLVVDNADLTWKQTLSDQYDGKTGKELSKAVMADGYDGIITTEGDRYISEIVDLTTFDEAKALYQSDAEEKNLIVTHNISEEGIAAAEGLGGLAAPSIAVANVEKGGFTNFGGISLLSDPNVLDDPTLKTFDADIYSARQPRSIDKLKGKKVRELTDAVDVANERTGLRPIYEVQEVSDLDKDSVFNYWLSTIGKSPKLKKMKATPLSKAVSNISDNELLESKELNGAVIKIYKGHVEQLLGENPTQAELDLVLDVASDWFDVKIPDDVELRNTDDGVAYFRGDEQVSDNFKSERIGFVRYTRSLKESGNYELDFTLPKQSLLRESITEVRKIRDGFDQQKFREDLSKKHQNKKLRSDFKEWINDTYSDLLDKKRLFKGYTPAGDRKYAEYTLNNVVREMTKTLQGGESSSYGVASVRARFANELSTKEKVKAARGDIVTKEEMDIIREEAAKKFEDSLEDLKQYYKYDTDGWGYGTDVAEAITEGPSAVREVFGNSKEANKIIDDLGKYLAGLPTEYFESKVQRSMQFSEFNTAVVPKGASKKTVDTLKSHGLKIRRYDESVEGSRNEVVAQQSKLLFQPAQTDGTDKLKRGSIRIDDDSMIIKMHQASDLSTFLHESGHMFLEMEGKLAELTGVTGDQQTILDWLEVDSFNDIDTEQHEKFAETFEVYLREGKAPSLALRDAFAAFKRWLIRIYQNLTDQRLQRADLSEEIVEVFDRLLATEAEIELATANPAYDQFFKSKEQAGMTDAEWDAYLKRQQQTKNRSQETLDTKVMKELEYRYSEDWKNEKAPMIDEEMERLSEEPVYSVLNDTTEIPMDRKMVKEFLGVDKLPKQLYGRTVKDGVDPQEYSEVYGFASPEQMLKEIVAVPPLKEAADAAAQDRMIEKYGDILNDGTIEAEAQEAIHNETQAQLLLEELRALKPERANKINRDYLKAEAKTLIGSMKFKEIQPNKYYRAEIKAAQKAVTAKDKEQQYIHKVQQLANHYMYREAVETKGRMTKHRKYVKSVQTREYNTKQVNPEYVQNMKVLANLYDMRQKPDQQVAVNNILNWYMSQIDDENQFVQLELLDVNLIKALDAKQNNEITELKLPTFDDLSAQDLQGLNDMLRHLRYVGGVMSDLGKAEFNKTIDDMTESILKHGKSDHKGRGGVARRLEEQRRELSHFVNKFPSLRNLIRKLDGDFKDSDVEGVMHKEIFRLVEEANSNKITLNAELHKKFQEVLGDIYRVGLTRGGNKTYLLDSGLTFDAHNEARFMLAVYWGTETSREAIREGHGMTDADVMKIMSDLTPEQLNMVNKVWEMNETVWPQLSSASVKLLGVAPPKLDAMPFVVNGVEMSGGHMRLMYDSSRLDLKADQEQATRMQTVVPTRAGSTFARVGGGGSPVKLYTSNISQSLEENIHYIAFAESGRRTQGLINNPKVKQAIEQKHGTGFFGALIENLEGTISNRSYRETVKTIARISKLLRRAATYKHLCFSIRNTVQQFSSLPVIVDELGVVPTINAMNRIVSDTGLIDFINDRSPFMKERASFVNREAAEFLKDLDVTNNVQKKYRDFASKGFFMQTAVDSLLAYPAWLATYERQFELHGDDKRASSEANTAVAESVGSGSDLHMGALFQKNQSEFVKIMTLFGSWFNSYYQRMYRSTEGWTTADAGTIKALFMTPVISATMAALLVMDYPDDDSDEAWYEWMTKRYVSFMGGTIPFIRDIVGSFSGYSPKTLLGGGQETAFRLYGEFDSFLSGKQSGVKTVSDVTKAVTTLVPVAGIGNVTRVMDFIDSNSQGKESGNAVKKTYQAIVEGKDKN